MSASSPVRTRLGLRGRLVLLVVAALGPLASYQIYELVQERDRRISAAIERVQECGFRRKPATHSDAKPASVPI
ncbi:MAG: hypothetical protein K2Y56_25125 [Methylobacterium sp.]|uniref:hypothetical protein n=1 Tax=Methylobacterium sp. TaxID=409 RepID=UPI0025D23A1D|nr:hypothetical protein [Methylobacterium sp.]MBX9934754.1 hypothetical protein [Methylobacterium sp.]